ncbi:hypothetical protein DDZ13_10190 [Coraliomargarita sinensis]|uniref:Transposase IS200-like domain-containing protein n=1 Tax=Coraliomargarita sinensis TaxID=2174842 RepID=A0A317ZID0_9BACT|nr:transposase [Coraliomargarita sinensis]PXA03658.1 hypothetical protein DDZ13_10190 [Coraliomargarita sinensis]
MLVPGEDFEFFNPYAEVAMTRANLPHWQQKRVLYFVTFRLNDSIPREKLRDWRIHYENWLRANPKPWNEQQHETYLSEFARKVERWLDAGHGDCCLKKTACRDIVADCLTFQDPHYYRLDAWTISANHVHALVAPRKGHRLPEIMKSWKGVTARRINRHLERSGPLWQKEYYDHIVRNPMALERIRAYIRRHDL